MENISLAEVAQLIDAEMQGDPGHKVTGIAALNNARSADGRGQISFFEDVRLKEDLAMTQAIAVMLRAEHRALCPVPALIVKNPYEAYAKVASLFVKKSAAVPGIHPTAIVDPTSKIHPTASIGAYCVIEGKAIIDANVFIGAGVYIGEESVIGADSYIYPGVKILHQITIGKRAVIHSGAVIGSDGFGFAPQKKGWLKIPQLGKVIIGDDVEIGANTTIDRGALNDTIIEQGVKLDNQIQIAHGVQIGANTAIAACVAIAGSAKIGANCMIGGAAAMAGHITITDNVVITGMGMVTHSLKEAGVYSSGTGIQPNRAWQKNTARYHRLDEMARRLRDLEQEIQVLKQHEDK